MTNPPIPQDRRPSQEPPQSPRPSPDAVPSADTPQDTEGHANVNAQNADVFPSKEISQRIKAAILSLRTQVPHPSVVDRLLDNLSPATATETRMPFTVVKVVTTASPSACIHNMLGSVVLAYGKLARGEEEWTPELDIALSRLEEIAKDGLYKYFAVPVEMNSVIHVLRTSEECREIETERLKREEAVRARKEEARDVPDGE